MADAESRHLMPEKYHEEEEEARGKGKFQILIVNFFFMKTNTKFDQNYVVSLIRYT